MEHTLAQEGKTGAPVHATLNQLEFGVGPFSRAEAFGVRDACHHPVMLAHQSRGKLGEFWDATRLAVGDPALQERSLALVEHPPKPLHEVVERGERTMRRSRARSDARLPAPPGGF